MAECLHKLLVKIGILSAKMIIDMCHKKLSPSLKNLSKERGKHHRIYPTAHGEEVFLLPKIYTKALEFGFKSLNT